MKHLAVGAPRPLVFVPFLLAQDSDRFQVQLLAKGYTYTDGPAWSKDGFLIFSDTPADQLLKWFPANLPRSIVKTCRAAGNAFRQPGPAVHLRNQSPARHPHRQERRHRGAGRPLGSEAPERAERHRGRPQRSRYFTDPPSAARPIIESWTFTACTISHPRGRSKLWPNSPAGPMASRFLPMAACCT